MIGMWKHLLGPFFKIPMLVWPYRTIWEEKVESFELVSKLAAKSAFPTFLKNIEIWCLGWKYRSEMFRNRKSILETYLQDAGWNMDFEKKKFFLKDFMKEKSLKKFHFFKMWTFFLGQLYHQMWKEVFCHFPHTSDHQLLKNFLQCQTMLTCVLEVYWHDAEQVFIMVYEVWSNISRNREKIQMVLILIINFLS